MTPDSRTSSPGSRETGPETTTAHNLPELSVSDLSQALKRTVEDAFGRVRVRGEISQPKIPGSGHCYLRLKDDGAVLDGVIWRGTMAKLSLRPEEGLEVVATGRLTTYPGRSSYQIIIESLELAGEGALLKMLEERKRRLTAEGLFAAERKRPLPFLPRVVGVVTSPTGAVIRDILHRLGDRFPVHVLVWPVRVQGDGAAEEITAAIQGFNTLTADGAVPRPDVLIVARGGGSLEDLMAFNEESVVRAAAASAIPLVSAVGHETDTTLIDFAADLRAPTPTGAAEMVVPVRLDLMAQVTDDGRRLLGAMGRLLEDGDARLTGLLRGLPDPVRLIEDQTQRLDDRAQRLDLAWPALLERRQAEVDRLFARLRSPREVVALRASEVGHLRGALDGAARRAVDARAQALDHLSARLRPEPLVRDADRKAADVARLSGALEGAATRTLDETARRLATAGKLLESYSFRSVLDRGFALVRDADDRPVTAAAALRPGQSVALQFADGRVDATVRGEDGTPPPSSPPPAAAPKRRAASTKKPRDGRQGSLLDGL
ncbi:exodeoxyribonuclease VII large subunit [Roseospira marina]|uniref:Exodeoxyribonuclease 7 large subunit n=1 Tax=Roseospira marina TaxID=140057 RepID=A0A5M6IBH8_9PROT|nr:exodeoxyribonuclease VII large subunit [Roseospira marina]KAA5605089.1 exodeoxyribonuclease VII large subunit [Roseospira marina]MBB4314836.1 exodeoxyribonuclease VII large subunit [Roseospira marina]MBB5087836.1 exodeoxyribonuclease VII large subunit [Roseospira marina]